MAGRLLLLAVMRSAVRCYIISYNYDPIMMMGSSTMVVIEQSIMGYRRFGTQPYRMRDGDPKDDATRDII